ncbi:MAG: pre-peptidase C-terminal domain-containing protein [Acidobacteriota bacterium]
MSACVADAPIDNHADVTFTDSVHAMPYGADSGKHPLTAPSGAHLTYYGGKVIQNVKVVEVLYGSGTYIPQLTSTTGTTMASFYTQGVTSGVWDWLTEYNSSSPAQTIGRGTFGGSKQITPASSRDGTTISDANIQAELAAQIQANNLIAPTDNVIYMIHFPKGKNITDPSGSGSCVSGGFCAYHGTMKIGSQNVYYGVLPDMTGGCATGCGSSPSTFNNQTSVASHELIEAVTDAEVGLATTLGPPLAWYDNTNGEIGDICNGQQGTFVGGDGVTYTIQQEFSNQASDCITTRSTTTNPDFSVAVSPSSATVTQGSSTSFTVTTTAIAGSTQTVALSVSGLPSGVTGSFSPSSVTAGGSSTLTVTASSTATGSSTFTVTGTSGATTHTASAMLSVGTSGGGGGTLSNGVPVTNLSGAKGSQQAFSIVVPAGQSTLTVSIAGGSGDADLYVKASSAPTLSSYDCRPYLYGNNETCTFSSPTATTYYIMLNGYAAYSGVTLTATYGADTTTALSNNVPVSNLSGATGSQQYWKITVPAGQTSLVVQISSGSGDADLYVRKGSKPTTSTYDCRPYLYGNNEKCTFTNPVATDYYVMLRGYAAYTGVSLVAHYP